jgi:acetyltransferase
MTIRNLDSPFKPDKIALICGGGDRDEIIAHNLMSGGFKGPIMPVDSKRWALEGALAYRQIADLPLPPALAIITRPLSEVPALIGPLGERGTRAAILSMMCTTSRTANARRCSRRSWPRLSRICCGSSILAHRA